MGMQTIEERISAPGHRRLSIEKIESHGERRSLVSATSDSRDEDAWKVDESWTSIIGYMAELSFPGEG
jgi:hypothetical protein